MASLPPELDLNGDAAGNDSSVGYAEGDPITPIAPEAIVSDPDSEDFEGGRLTVDFASGGTAEDQLRIAEGEFFVEESDLYYQGIPIGTITGGTDGFTPLVVTFYAGATADIAAALIRAIGYVSYSGALSAGQRQIRFTLADGDGGTSVARVATVTVTAEDSAPVAQDDSIAADEDKVAAGSLFADNGNGTDSDPDGPALTVAEVNGSAANVGEELVLESGAILIVNADGTYSYDPNGRFDDLADASTGAVNSSVVADSFSYTLAGGGTATVTVTVNGVASPGDRLRGDEDDNVIVGTEAVDIFVLDQGGFDEVQGRGGSDIFYFGGALGDDIVDGGAGDDTIVLQGDYAGGLILDSRVTGIEAISILASANTAFGGSGEASYDYSIITHDSNFAAGVRARINGGALVAGESFRFDGSAETDSSFLIYGGAGIDSLTGGRGNDIFFFDIGRFAGGDSVNGGAGYDGLFLRGDYAIDFSVRGLDGQVTGIENLTLTSATDQRYAKGGGSAFSYELTLSNSMASQGQTLTVSGALLTAEESMVVDGSQEIDGQLRMFGGAAGDRLIGGAKADLIQGGLGGDELIGGDGADVFRYQSTADSTSESTDEILDFEAGTDRVELVRIDADTNTAGDQAFRWIGGEAFSGSAGELRAFEEGSTWYVEGDVDGDGVADLVILLTIRGETPLTAGDFLL